MGIFHSITGLEAIRKSAKIFFILSWKKETIKSYWPPPVGFHIWVRKSPSSLSQRFATKEFCTPSIPKIRPSHYRKSDRSVQKIDQLIVPSPHETKFTSISSLEVPTSKIFASVNLPNLNLLSKEAFQMTLQSFNTPPQPFLLLLRLNRLLLEQDHLMDRSVLALEPELLSLPEALHQTSNKVVLL